MDCPLCDKTHEVEERKRFTTITLKGEKVTYEERFYFCADSDEDENEFETGAMTNENLLNARNAYRVKHGLLTSGEIVAIRESYGLSQVDLARLLGWGEATISRAAVRIIVHDKDIIHLPRQTDRQKCIANANRIKTVQIAVAEMVFTPFLLRFNYILYYVMVSLGANCGKTWHLRDNNYKCKK